MLNLNLSRKQPLFPERCSRTLKAYPRTATHLLYLFVWLTALSIPANSQPLRLDKQDVESIIIGLLVLVVVGFVVLIVRRMLLPPEGAKEGFQPRELQPELRVWDERDVQNIAYPNSKMQGWIQSFLCNMGLLNREMELSRARTRIIETLQIEAKARIELREIAIEHTLKEKEAINKQVDLENNRLELLYERRQIESGKPRTSTNHKSDVENGSLLSPRSAAIRENSPKAQFRRKLNPEGSSAQVNVAESKTASDTRRKRLLDDYQHLTTLTGHRDGVESVAFSPDGLLASASRDQTIRLWEPHVRRHTHKLKCYADVYTVAFSPDGRLLASGDADGVVLLWGVGTWATQVRFIGHGDGIQSLAFSADGKLLVSASWDQTVNVWDLKTMRLLETLEDHQQEVSSIAFSPDNVWMASASWDRTIRVWDRKTWQAKEKLNDFSKPISSLTFLPDGNLVSGSWDNMIRIFAGPSSEKPWDEEMTLNVHSGPISSLAASPNGRIFASSSDDGTVRLWNSETYALVKTFEEHSDRVASVAFSRNGQFLASGSEDKTVQLYRRTK